MLHANSQVSLDKNCSPWLSDINLNQQIIMSNFSIIKTQHSDTTTTNRKTFYVVWNTNTLQSMKCTSHVSENSIWGPHMSLHLYRYFLNITTVVCHIKLVYRQITSMLGRHEFTTSNYSNKRVSVPSTNFMDIQFYSNHNLVLSFSSVHVMQPAEACQHETQWFRYRTFQVH